MPAQAKPIHQPPPRPGAQAEFTSIEWLVIALGARDGSVPLRWSPLGQRLLKLFGVSVSPQRLASPCLESLRHMACLARRHGWSIPAAEIGMFLREGWSEAQLERLVESVAYAPSSGASGLSLEERGDAPFTPAIPKPAFSPRELN